MARIQSNFPNGTVVSGKNKVHSEKKCTRKKHAVRISDKLNQLCQDSMGKIKPRYETVRPVYMHKDSIMTGVITIEQRKFDVKYNPRLCVWVYDSRQVRD